MQAKLKKAAISFASAVFWLLVWYIAALIVNKEVLLPSPVAVISRLMSLMREPSFYLTCLSSSVHILFGFIAGLIFGVILGSAMSFSSVVRALFSPLLKVVRSTPVASFIILALVWLNSSHIPSFIAFLMVLPIFCSNVTQGLSSVDGKLKEVTDVFELSRSTKLKILYVPTLIPFVASAAKTGIGLAWKAGVAAEVIAVTANSIGAMLRDSKTYLETADLFAWTAALILISALMELIIGAASDALSKRFAHSEGGEKA